MEVEGSGGGLLQLVECFPCTSNQLLVNRTCINAETPTEERIGMSMHVWYKRSKLRNGERKNKLNVHCINLYEGYSR